jgi:enediyne biosynthesis protein E4
MLRRTLIQLLFVALCVSVWWFDRESKRSAVSATQKLGFAFEDHTAASGVQFQHRVAPIDERARNAQDHVMAVGAAVSAVDFDQDGWIDLYFTNSDFKAPNALYRNLGGSGQPGRFVDVAASAGLADLNVEGRGVCMGSLWGDLENDGDPDVLIYRYGYLGLYQNQGDGTFKDIGLASGLERWMNSNAACFLDYDRDGLLDVYVAGYYKAEHNLWNLRTTKIMHDSGQFAANGGKNVLLRNLGPDSEGIPRFQDMSDAFGLDSTLWTLAVAAADLDQDGWQDIYVANDYGEEQVLRNLEGRGFEDLEDIGFDHHSKSGMSVTFGNVRNDGLMSIFVTNISAAGYILHGNNLRINGLPAGQGLTEEARGDVIDTGWAWGSQFGDFDNDGYQDLVVVNGFVSGSESSYWYEASKLAAGSGDILSDAASWPPFKGRSQSGYERTRVLRNAAGRSFVEVGEQVGVVDRLDGRAVILADLENRGALDMVVANQKGPALIYRNTPDPDNRWIGFEFEGTRSNRDALGATVKLYFGRYVQTRVITSASGFSAQNDHRVHLGLGTFKGLVDIEIRWPSGRIEKKTGFAPGTYHRLVESVP